MRDSAAASGEPSHYAARRNLAPGLCAVVCAKPLVAYNIRIYNLTIGRPSCILFLQEKYLKVGILMLQLTCNPHFNIDAKRGLQKQNYFQETNLPKLAFAN